MELANLFQPLEEQLQVALHDMDIHSDLTIFVGSNGVEIDMQEANAQPVLEGN